MLRTNLGYSVIDLNIPSRENLLGNAWSFEDVHLNSSIIQYSMYLTLTMSTDVIIQYNKWSIGAQGGIAYLYKTAFY